MRKTFKERAYSNKEFVKVKKGVEACACCEEQVEKQMIHEEVCAVVSSKVACSRKI